MPSFIARQPNGLLCRFSTTVDTLTHWNMSEEDYIVDVQMHLYGRNRAAAEIEAADTIKHYLRPFSEVISHFVPTNDSREDFLAKLSEMGVNVEYNII